MPSTRKRSLSPFSSTATMSKRSRTSATSTSSSSLTRPQPLTLNAHSLSDELFLSILVYLSPYDLSSVERVDRHMMRLSNDQHLWRTLYLDAHPHEALGLGRRVGWQGGPSAGTGGGGRAIARLPHRARRGEQQHREQPGIDWKYLFRISTNWSSGRSTLHPLLQIPIGRPSSPPFISPISSSPPSSPSFDPQAQPTQTRPQTLLALANPFIISASRRPTSTVPSITVFLAKMHHSFQGKEAGSQLATIKSEGLARERSNKWLQGAVGVVDLVVDGAGWQHNVEGASSHRIYAAYTSGSFSILTLSLSDDASSPSSPLTIAETFFQPSPTAAPLQLSLISALHGSLLVTCTDTFSLAFYNLPSSNASTFSSTPLRPFRTLKSHTSWFPAALVLSPQSAGTRVKATLAYTIPVYPSSWSISLQEIVLSPERQGWRMESTRTLSALAGSTFLPAELGEEAREGEAVLRGRVMGMGLSEKWVVVGGADNSVLCSEIPSEEEEKEKGKSGRLRVGRAMVAHWGEVGAVCVRGDRCITADALGRILVWDLPSLFPSPSPPSASSEPTARSRSSSPPPSPPPSLAFPSPSLTPRPPPFHPSSASRPFSSFVEVLPPPKPNGDARGEERVVWVGQDEERIVSLSRKRDWEEWEGQKEGGEERVKIWEFDC